MWNVGFLSVDLISKMSGFCWEELTTPSEKNRKLFNPARSWGFEFVVGKDFKVTFHGV